MSVPARWLDLIGKGQKRHDRGTAAHEVRLRKVGIQHFTFKYRICLRMALSYHHRHFRLDDSSFFKGYFRQGFSQHVAMIQANVRNDAQHRSHYVRTVKTSAKACLKNDDIGLDFRKPAQSHGSRDLKEGHVKMVECFLPLVDEVPYIILRNQCKAVFIDHPHPLPEIQNMRRRVQSDLQPLRGKSRRQHVRNRTFAIRTRNMYQFILPVRMPCQLIEEFHIPCSGLISASSDFLKRREPHKQL